MGGGGGAGGRGGPMVVVAKVLVTAIQPLLIPTVPRSNKYPHIQMRTAVLASSLVVRTHTHGLSQNGILFSLG